MDQFQQYEIVPPPVNPTGGDDGEGENMECYIFLPKFRETRLGRPKVWKTDGTPYTSPTNGNLVAYVWSHPRGDKGAATWSGYVPYDSIRVIPRRVRGPRIHRGLTPPPGGGGGPRKCSVCRKENCRVFHQGVK